MPDVLAQSLAQNFTSALHLLRAALSDTPDELWETDLWPDEAPTTVRPDGGMEGSAPWFLGYHALSVLDYDLSAELEPWQPPKPFDENVWSLPARVFTRAELLDYTDYCRVRVDRTLESLTGERSAQPVPSAHRYAGSVYGVLIGTLPMHVVEHASQVRQFLTTSGIRVQRLPGDRGYERGSPDPS